MSQHEQTSDHFLETLTGHDEMAIAQHFGQTIGELVVDRTMFSRALVFVVNRRLDGVNDDDARNVALDLPLKQILDYFAEESEEAEETGKDEPVTEPLPEPSLTSVI